MKKLGEVEGEGEVEGRLIPLLTEIRDLLRENNTLLREDLTSAKTLAERRERDAERKRTKRQEGEMSADNALTERTENEKRENPPTPPLKE